MPEPRDFTTSRFEYRTYKVGRSLLDRLFSVASEGAGGDKVNYATTRSGTTFQRGSLEDLVSAVAASSMPGDPEIWGKLSFDYRDGTRSVNIDIHELWLTVSICGDDATWVHGQAARIRALIDPVSGEDYSWEKRHGTVIRIAGCAGVVASVSSFFALREIFTSANTAMVAIASLSIGALVFPVVLLLSLQGKGKPKVFLSVVGEIADVGWWKNFDVMERIAFGALIATVVAAIGTLGSAYSDLWGGK